MGCWNATCALSGLPIMYGDLVRVFLLMKPWKHMQEKKDNSVNLVGSGWCHAAGLLTPVSFPLKAYYNDYGSVEDIEDDASLALLKTYLKETFGNDYVADGEKITLDDMEQFFKGVERSGMKEERGLQVDGKPVHFAFCLMREDVYSHMVVGHRIDADESMIFASAQKYASKTDPMEQMRVSCALNDHLFAMMDIRPYVGWVFKEALIQAYTEGNQPLIEKYKRMYKDYYAIYKVMEYLRKLWMPGSGAGHQNLGWELHDKLASKVSEICRKEIAEYGMEEE